MCCLKPAALLALAFLWAAVTVFAALDYARALMEQPAAFEPPAVPVIYERDPRLIEIDGWWVPAT